MQKKSIYFHIILISFLSLMILLSLTYDSKTGQVPFLIGLFTFGFAAMSLIGELFPNSFVFTEVNFQGKNVVVSP